MDTLFPSVIISSAFCYMFHHKSYRGNRTLILLNKKDMETEKGSLYNVCYCDVWHNIIIISLKIWRHTSRLVN